MDDLHYLEPGFDPATLTIPNLRNILVTHDVDYPSSAKKPQLVELFNAHVRPLARKLLAARARVRRSASGIENVVLSQEVDEDEDEDEEDDAGAGREMTPVAPQRATRQSSRASSLFSSRAATAESEAPSIAQSVASRRSTRHSSLRPSEASEAESETPRRPSARHSSRTSIVKTPAAVKEESPVPDDDSPFTNNNIFQQGGSPTVDTQRRRTTLGAEQKRQSSGRRKSEMTPAARKSTSRTSTFKVPIAATQPDYDDGVEAGEEFASDQELTADAEADESNKQIATRRRKTRTSSGTTLKGLFAILTVMSGAVFYKWREEKLAVGFCGVGRPSTSIGGVEIPDWAPAWAEAILPQCEPCPAHAYCGIDLEATCEADFILHPHPLSLGGAIPLPPACEPDSEKAKRVQAVADRAVEVLRERNAKYECGELRDESGKKAEAPLPEPELKATVSAARRRSLTQDEFEDIWESVLPDLRKRDEISSGKDGSDRETLRSNSLARISFGCAVRRSIRATLAEYLRYIVIVALVVGGAAYARYTFRSKRTLEAKGKQLAGFALDRLATQAALYADARAPEAFIAVNQLRDDVLRDEFSRKSREAVWERVRHKVEGNANVRSSMKETRTGDMARVWEWIGALDALDDDSSSSPWGSGVGASRRKSGRFSMGPPVARSIEDTPSAQPGEFDVSKLKRRSSSPRKSEPVERKMWQESRPIY